MVDQPAHEHTAVTVRHTLLACQGAAGLPMLAAAEQTSDGRSPTNSSVRSQQKPALERFIDSMKT
jgi:hypothetical protein